MNYNQNEKIAQITSQTLIIGVDIAKFKHVARAQDYRGIEFGSLHHLRKAVSRSVGINKILELKQAAKESIGLCQRSNMAKLELATLLDKYDLIQKKFVELDNKIGNLIEHIPCVQQLLAIKGVGRNTVAGFFAEVGNLQDYSHPRQIIKLAGLSLKENTSGKHKG